MFWLSTYTYILILDRIITTDNHYFPYFFHYRQVIAPPRNLVIQPNYHNFGNNGKSYENGYQQLHQDQENPQISSDLEGGHDYVQRPPEVYLNPPVYQRGDHGPEIDNENSAGTTKPLYIPNQRLVHLDLKGAPPKIEFLISFLKKIKDLGATGKNDFTYYFYHSLPCFSTCMYLAGLGLLILSIFFCLLFVRH